MLNALCLAVGLGGGWLADRALGTLPLFMLVGMVLGVVAGALGTRAELRRYNR
jgi:F0F1-type ATP synthase assembly protein I